MSRGYHIDFCLEQDIDIDFLAGGPTSDLPALSAVTIRLSFLPLTHSLSFTVHDYETRSPKIALPSPTSSFSPETRNLDHPSPPAAPVMHHPGRRSLPEASPSFRSQVSEQLPKLYVSNEDLEILTQANLQPALCQPSLPMQAPPIVSVGSLIECRSARSPCLPGQIGLGQWFLVPSSALREHFPKTTLMSSRDPSVF